MRAQVKLSLLDTLGVAIAGRQSRAAQIICDFADANHAGALPMLFDGRRASPAGFALAAGITIDSLDAHDGFNPSKGHIAAPMMPVALAAAYQQGSTGDALLQALILGYEFGARAAIAQHSTAPDYHTSGSWGAVAGARVAARLAGLSPTQTRHAVGIAEYYGPRSQMMRLIDHPSMLKDGAGWGAMAGASAVGLAQAGFTGAPALIVEQVPEAWADLGERWYALEQYYKPYPVCRWAQAPIEGVLAHRHAHDLTSDQVERIEVTTFHESIRLAMREPQATDEAQYSTSFPCAVALVRGDVTPADIADDALFDPEILRLSRSLVMRESDHADAAFPLRRYAKVDLVLKDGRRLEGDYVEPRWDHTAPPTPAELREKFHQYAVPVVGAPRAAAIEAAVDGLENSGLAVFFDLITAPI
ncbi:MmgE/PrpD family protein [Tritonibacter multivorans]|uniref:MmgE/PrpD family protein n=1 Tax=Tritonibacter multivorans TaxID=928856 RepID=A0A0P1GFN8_9RHOB|nr:MmgE/PrpD family protein [Tritonibacter multivorans]SFC79049.1 2-methylcitrate dehydratase PrpD [Tritonibacter multivorans]